MFVTKKADSKGRVTLGKEYANTILIIIKEDKDNLMIQRAEVIPAAEVWLHKNKAALKSVRTGIDQARKGRFSKTPINLKDDDDWLDEVEE